MADEEHDLGSEIVNNWWRRDYSWEGLTQSFTDARGTRESLQSYWTHVLARLDLGPDYLKEKDYEKSVEAKLEEFDGKRWTPFHYPFISSPDQSPRKYSRKRYQGEDDALKAADTFNKILGLVDEGFLTFADFSGSCFDFKIDIVGKRLLKARFDSCDFSREVKIDAVLEAIKTDESNTMYFEPAERDFGWWLPAQFVHSRFGRNAEFRLGEGQSDFYFLACQFQREVSFAEAKLNAPELSVFYRCEFGRANFRRASLKNSYFYQCTFRDRADFLSSTSKNVVHNDSQFRGNADFSFSSNEGEIAFTEVQFEQMVSFEGANFSSSGSKAKSALFWRNCLDFGGASFKGYANFTGVRCDVPANFAASRALGQDSGAEFAEVAFQKGRVTPPLEIPPQKLALPRSSHDTGYAIPYELRWQSQVKLDQPRTGWWPIGRINAIDPPRRSTIFNRHVDFSGRAFRRQANFSNVEFNGGVCMESVSFDREPILVDTHWADVSKFDEYDEEKVKASFRRDGQTDEAVLKRLVKRHRQTYLDEKNLEMESTFRFLKKLMESHRNKPEEDKYFKLELGRRLQRHDIGSVERIVARFYRTFSDFGTSVSLPIQWLLGLNAVMFLVYLVMMRSDPNTYCGGAETGRFLMERLFAPFEIWTAEYAQVHHAARDCVDQLIRSGGVGLMLTASLTSVADVMLVFLAVLALRRRFQIA